MKTKGSWLTMEKRWQVAPTKTTACGLGVSAHAPGPAPAGFTLLEVVVALGLSTVLIALVGMAVHLHLSVYDASRLNAGEVTLARNILHRIAADLRCLVVASGSNAAKNSTGSLATTNTATTAAAPGVGGTDANDTGPAAGQETSSSAQELVRLVRPSHRPGLYGTASRLQIDVSRPPRLDQYLTAATSPGPSLTVGTVQTLSYFVDPDAAAQDRTAAGSVKPPAAANRGGLMRTSTVRAVAQWSSESGGQEPASTDVMLMAAEVSSIRFRYSNGIEWLDLWDAEGQLPVAVEIVVTFGDAAAPTFSEDTSVAPSRVDLETTARDDEPTSSYRLVVALVPRDGQATSSGNQDTDESEAGTEPSETAGPTP